MKKSLRSAIVLTTLIIMLTGVACEVQPTNPVTNTSTATSPAPATTNNTHPRNLAVTLPVLDAFLADQAFAGELKSKLQLTDEQVAKLKTIAREETARLRESDNGEYQGTTSAAREQAYKQIEATVGAEKTVQLLAFVNERWGGNGAATGTTATVSTTPGAVPADTRIVVNAPAFRMDVFDKGQLIKSYKIGIGYPEFPLPTGLRKAETIIFNPTWTPPDEPWVEAPGSKVKVGETVKAGDKLNPLGVLKIPIGGPSLIHGGKAPAKLGNFASHGCVGLTNPQAQDFAKLLAQLGEANLTDEQVSQYEKNKTETQIVKLGNAMPVELRYETIRVEDGKLHIYRDVYDRDTNTEENLRAVLGAYGVTLEQLRESERTQVMGALKQMSRDASGKMDQDASKKSEVKVNNNASGKVTRTIKGQKEVVIEIAALKGEGYPAPVNLDTGGTKKVTATSKKQSASR